MCHHVVIFTMSRRNICEVKVLRPRDLSRKFRPLQSKPVTFLKNFIIFSGRERGARAQTPWNGVFATMNELEPCKEFMRKQHQYNNSLIWAPIYLSATGVFQACINKVFGFVSQETISKFTTCFANKNPSRH